MTQFSGKKVLLVEDDTFLANALKIRLEENEIVFSHAVDGEKALKMMQSDLPDLVILDLMMPKKDGFSVLKDMQKDDALRNVPVVVVSNLTQQTDIERALALGAKDVLAKSEVSTAEILETIGKYVK